MTLLKSLYKFIPKIRLSQVRLPGWPVILPTLATERGRFVFSCISLVFIRPFVDGADQISGGEELDGISIYTVSEM